MAVISNIKAKILIQVGEVEPVQIGEVEIPVELTVSEPAKPAPTYRSAGPQNLVLNVDSNAVQSVSAGVSAVLRRNVGVTL